MFFYLSSFGLQTVKYWVNYLTYISLQSHFRKNTDKINLICADETSSKYV